jgi:hypothetical protein
LLRKLKNLFSFIRKKASNKMALLNNFSRWFWGHGDDIRHIPQTLNTFARKAGNTIGSIGSGINTFARTARKIHNTIGELVPAYKALPIHQTIETGLNLGSATGNLLERLGEGKTKDIARHAGYIAEKLGGDKAKAIRVGHSIENAIHKGKGLVKNKRTKNLLDILSKSVEKTIPKNRRLIHEDMRG